MGYLNKISNKSSIFLFVTLYATLLIGFFLGEDSTGGAFADYLNQKRIAKNFALNFFDSFLNYGSGNESSRHSPVLVILLSIFEKLKLNDLVIRLINLQIAPICSIIFYNCLKLKFPNVKKEYILLFSAIFFLSPTIRSLSIWPDSRIYGLTFFILSVYFFLNFQNKKKLTFAIYNVVLLSISSYFSPNFSVFSVYFFVNYLIYYKISKDIFLIFFLNIALAFPAFYYLFVLDINFLKVPAIDVPLIQRFNLSNKIILISSIFLFYYIPFLALYENKLKFFKKIFNYKSLLITLLFSFLLIYFFSYEQRFTGGGIFFHISNLIFNNNLLLFLIFYFSFLLIIEISKQNIKNLSIFILVLCSNPQLTIYHKYYDPLFWILLLLLMSIKLNLSKIFDLKNIFIFYLFSLSLLLISLFK
tara:strand:+ start:7148 stop:8395 length:1248 start_codon:yes stop_codon:yes gene_type:complete